MDVTAVNTPFERECLNCGTTTRSHYKVDKTGIGKKAACTFCVNKVIDFYSDNGVTKNVLHANRTNVSQRDDSDGDKQWHPDVEPLSKEGLLRVIDDEFIENGRSIRSDATIFARPKGKGDRKEIQQLYIDNINELLEEDKIRVGEIGVDDGDAYEPTFERQAKHMMELQLVDKWREKPIDIDESRIQAILDTISDNTQYSKSELQGGNTKW
jgi:hypothetical protein